MLRESEYKATGLRQITEHVSLRINDFMVWLVTDAHLTPAPDLAQCRPLGQQ